MIFPLLKSYHSVWGLICRTLHNLHHDEKPIMSMQLHHNTSSQQTAILRLMLLKTSTTMPSYRHALQFGFLYFSWTTFARFYTKLIQEPKCRYPLDDSLLCDYHIHYLPLFFNPQYSKPSKKLRLCRRTQGQIKTMAEI